MHAASTDGSSVTVDFTGIGATLITEKNNDLGDVDIQVCATGGTSCGPTTRVNLYSPTRQVQVPAFSISGLTNATHSLKITKVNGLWAVIDAIWANVP